MDFANFEIEDNNASFWVHLEVEGSPLFWDEDKKAVTMDVTDKPCRVKMRSAAHNSVYAAFNKYQAAENAHKLRVQRASDKDIEAIAAKHMVRSQDLMDDLIAVAAHEFENIYFDGKAEALTEDLLRKLIDRKANAAKRAIRTQLFNSIVEKRENLTDAV